MKTDKIKNPARILYILACSMLLFFSSCERNDLYEKTRQSIFSVIDMVGIPYIALYQGPLKLSSGSLVNIGEAAIAGSGNSIVFTVTNTGNRNLALTGSPVPVSVSGTNPGDYIITQPALNYVTSGGTLTFSVNFIPSAPGVRDATLTIRNDDPNGDPFIINLTGNGLVPMLVVHGNGSKKTSIYDPAKNQFTAGLNLSVNVNSGGFSFQVPPGGSDYGKMMILHADAAGTTTLYDPSNGTTSPGPLLFNPIGLGAHSFLAASGTFGGMVIIVCGGNSQNTNIYDTFNNRFLTSGDPLPFQPFPLWLNPANGGSHSIYDSIRGTWIIVHGGGSTNTTEFDLLSGTPANGPGAFVGSSNVDDGGHSFISSNGRIIMIYAGGVSNETALYTPGTAVLQGVFALWSPFLFANAGTGANTFMIMSGPEAGKNLIIQGGNSYITSLYNPGPPLPDTFQSGPDLPIALGPPASSGCHTFQINGGSFSGWTMVILGGNRPETALYDPINNLFIPGPPLIGGNAGAGAHSFPAR